MYNDSKFSANGEARLIRQINPREFFDGAPEWVLSPTYRVRSALFGHGQSMNMSVRARKLETGVIPLLLFESKRL